MTYPDAYAGGFIVMVPSDDAGRLDRMSYCIFYDGYGGAKFQRQTGNLYTETGNVGFTGSDVLDTDVASTAVFFKNSGTVYYNPVDTVFWIGRTKDDESGNQTSFNDMAYGFRVNDNGDGIANAGDVLELVAIIYSTGTSSVFGHTADELTAVANHPWNPPFTFPTLSTTYPLYSQLYSDVQVGNSTAAGAGSGKEGAETLSAVYAYLHPQSPHQYDPDYLARLKVLLDASFGVWAAASGSALSDIACSFQCAYTYMLLKHHRPGDLTAAEIADWEAALVTFCDYNLSKNTLLYDDHILAQLWLNGDIRIAKAIYFAGIALSNTTYQSEASCEYLLKKNCQNFIQFKATRGHPLSEEEHATNKLRSRIRVRCEHVFGRMSQMAMDQLRTIGLVRAEQHNALCNLVYNMDRYAFLRR